MAAAQIHGPLGCTVDNLHFHFGRRSLGRGIAQVARGRVDGRAGALIQHRHFGRICATGAAAHVDKERFGAGGCPRRGQGAGLDLVEDYREVRPGAWGTAGSTADGAGGAGDFAGQGDGAVGSRGRRYDETTSKQQGNGQDIVFHYARVPMC